MRTSIKAHEPEAVTDLLVVPGLILLVLATRIPFRSRQLYDWDAVQFALGLKHFDIRQHQPHPPGYPIFILLGRAANAIFPDVNTALVALAIGFSAASVVLIFWLNGRLFRSRQAGMVAALLWATSPLVWFYGEIASIYAASAFASVLIAATSWKHLELANRKTAILSGISFAFGCGLRPDQLLLMLPIWLFPFARKKDARRHFFLSAGFLAAGYLSWYVPLARTAGGVGQYSAIVREQFYANVRQTSFFFGAGLRPALLLLVKLGFALGLAVGLICAAVVLLLLVRRNRSGAPGESFRETWYFLITWALPALLFFAFIHIGQLGYVMSCTPPLIMGMAGLLWSATEQFPRLLWSCAAGIAAINTFVFLAAPSPVSISKLGREQYLTVENEIRTREHVAAVYGRDLSIHPGTILLVAAAGNSYLDWRRLAYELPQRTVWGIREWQAPGRVTVDFLHGGDLQTTPSTPKPLKLELPDSTKGSVLLVVPREPGLITVNSSSMACADVSPDLEQKLNLFQVLSCDLRSNEPTLRLGPNSVAVSEK